MNWVLYVQRRLQARGANLGPSGADGVWGEATQAAFDLAVPLPEASPPRTPVAFDQTLFRQLQRDEGLRLAAYPDPLSERARTGRGSGAPWTIGNGHTGPDVYEGLSITKAQSDALLVADMLAHNAVLTKVLPWVDSLDAPRRRVLQNMHFNMGWDNPRTPKLEGLAGFVNTLRFIHEGQYAAAASGMEASLWFTQTGDRAKRLVATMRDGVDR